MATVAEVLHWQDCILRVENNATATALANSGLSDTEILNILLEDAENSTQPGLLVYSLIFGETQSEALLDQHAVFMEAQFNSYVALGVQNPELGPYEAMGRSLSQTAEFLALTAGQSAPEVITDWYVIASNGTFPGDAQINHFVAQYNYFVGIFTAVGIPLVSAQQQALGAVVGQIIGVFAIQEGSSLDARAEAFLLGCIDGTSVFGAPLPGVEVGQLFLFQEGGGEIILGTPGDDTFRGQGYEIDASDTIYGYEGFDTADLFIDDFTVYSINSFGVERFVLHDAYGIPNNDYYFDFENVEGMLELYFEDFDEEQDVTAYSIQNNVVLGFEDFAELNQGGDVDIYFENDALGGSDATLYLVMNEAYLDNLNIHTYGGDAITTLDVTAINGQARDHFGEYSDCDDKFNYFDLDIEVNGNDSPDDQTLRSIYVHGDGYVWMEDVDDEFEDVTLVDGRDNTGGFGIDLGNNDVNVTVYGGDGNDYVDFDTDWDTSDYFDGGDGNDTLEVDADDAIGTLNATTVQNVEVLRLDGELSQESTLFNVAGFTTVVLQNYTTNNYDLQLNGFDDIVIQEDQNDLYIDGTSVTTFTFDSCYNDYNFYIDNLTFYDGYDITLNLTDDDAYIDTLDLGDGTDPDTYFLTITGGTNSYLTIDNIENEEFLQIIDLSAFSGYFTTYEDWENDVDFYVGNLDDDSLIYLENSVGEVNELVFGPALTGDILVQYFDPGAGGDVLDFGDLGATSTTDLTLTDIGAGTDTLVEVAGQSGSVLLIGVNIADLDGAFNFDFDGVIG
jgi:hypothetical protein